MRVSDFQFRWLIRRDVDHVLPLLNIQKDNLIALLRQRNCIGIVLENMFTDEIIGTLIYELDKSQINIVFFGYDDKHVDIFFTSMVERMTDKLSQQRRTKLHVNVSEHDICSQIRLSEFGFLGAQVNDVVVMSYYLHKQHDDNDDDYYYGHQ